MGKYDKVIGKLPKAGPEGEPKFREKVEQRKRELIEAAGVLKPAAVAQQYTRARAEKDEIAERASAVEVDVQALDELMHTIFEEEGLSSLKLADGSSVTVGREPNASVVDKAALVKWAKANGYEAMLSMAWQSVNAIAKSFLEEGGEIALDENGDMTVMGGSVRVQSRPKTTLRRS